MWKVAMSEEVAKALQSVVERVNQAAARRPKVTAGRDAPLGSASAFAPLLGLWEKRAAAARIVM